MKYANVLEEGSWKGAIIGWGLSKKGKLPLNVVLGVVICMSMNLVLCAGVLKRARFLGKNWKTIRLPILKNSFTCLKHAALIALLGVFVKTAVLMNGDGKMCRGVVSTPCLSQRQFQSICLCDHSFFQKFFHPQIDQLRLFHNGHVTPFFHNEQLRL